MKTVLLLFTTMLTVSAGPRSLFDGKSFDGWEIPAGEEKWWKVSDGMIVGGSMEEKVPKNLFLSTKEGHANFELTLRVKLVTGEGFVNSGFQVRSQRAADGSQMTGYQVDAGSGYWGDLYDEHRRNRKLDGAIQPEALKKAVREGDWNDYRIRCEGRRIRNWINGVPALDYTERESAIPLDGKIGIQVHSGGTLQVLVKDLKIEDLPLTPGAPSWTPSPAAKPAPSAEKAQPLKADEELARFKLPRGFVAELVASEEQGVGKPITMAWDGRGRLWTMTALEYPVDGNENRAVADQLYASGGKDRVLVFDQPEKPGPLTPRVFAEGLAIPLGLLPDLDGNGALVHYGSQIRHYVDENRDGKADRHEVVLEGFGVQDSHLMPHQFERAPGGWIYVAQGLFNASKVRRPGGKVFADGTQEKAFNACKLARFRPDGSDFELLTAGPNNIWGFFQSRQGEAYLQEANDIGIPVAEFEPGTHYTTGSKEKLRPYAPRIPNSLTVSMGGTGLSGLASAEDQDSPFAQAYGGDLVAYVANPITNRIQVVSIDRASDRHPEYFKREDFLVSEDPCFRPVSVQFGPDGFLYIADWYNKIISHNEVPRAHPERDKTRGRIWRIRPEGGKAPLRQDLTQMTDAKLVAQLVGRSHRDASMAWAMIAGKPKALELIRQLPTDSSRSLAARLDGLWALEMGGRLNAPLLEKLSTDPLPEVRYQAVRAASESGLEPAQFVRLFGKYPDDPNYRVRAALANAVRHHPKPTPAMMGLVARLGRAPLDGGNEWDRYDRDFERYLARWAMESHLQATEAFLKEVKDLPLENHLLVALSLEPAKSATLLMELLPGLPRPLNSEEIAVLGGQLNQPQVLAGFRTLLADVNKRRALLQTLTRLDVKLLSDPALKQTVSDACLAMIQDGDRPEDRDLVIQLARLLRLGSLEPQLAKWLDAESSAAELVKILSAMKEMGSSRTDRFAERINHPDEAVRREALGALVASPDVGVVSRIAEIWGRLSGAQRVGVVDGLVSNKDKAVAFAQALKDGKFSGLEAGAYEKLSAVLGADHPVLKEVLEKASAGFRKVLRVAGKTLPATEELTLEGAFTVEAWIRLDEGIDNRDALFGKSGGQDFNFYQARLHLYGGKAAGDLMVAKRAMQPGVWTHCAITRDASGALRIYLDGELDQDQGKPSQEPFQGLKLGLASSGGVISGKLDEVRVWKSARSADEIRATYRVRIPDADGLVRRFSSDRPEAVPMELTADFPPLVSPEDAAAAEAKFAKFRAMIDQPGDAKAGRMLFQSTCMICHQVKGEGTQVGPDLSGVGAMGVQAVLRNVLDPNAQLESGYYRHDVTLTDGSLVSGFLVEETQDSLTLRPIGSEPRVVKRAMIANHVVSKRSLMPEGLLDGFNPKQVADLFEYLKGLK